MEGEKRRREEEVVHGMKLDTAHRSDDQHEKEEKEERDRCKETYSAGQRSWLKLLRHHHRYLIARHQVLIRPRKLPTIVCLMFLRGGKRVIGKINVPEVGLHLEREVANLTHIVTAKTIAPLVKTLGSIADSQTRNLSCRNLNRPNSGILLIANCHRRAVKSKSEIVIDRLRRREVEHEIDDLFFIAGVAETVRTGKRYFVCAVPEQTFLPVFQIKRDVHHAAFQRQRSRNFLLNGFDNLLAVLGAFFLPRHNLLKRGNRWCLVLRGSPGGSHAILGNFVQRICARKDGAAKNGPGYGGAYKNEGNGNDSFGHFKTPLEFIAQAD